MRLPRFNEFLVNTLRATPDPAVTDIQANSECGHNPASYPAGVCITLATGGRVCVQAMRGSGRVADDWDQAEEIIEADTALDPVGVAPIRIDSGRIQTVDVEAWIAAAITNAGSREVVAVDRLSASPSSHPFGVTLRFADDSAWHGAVAYTMGRGQQPNPNSRFHPAGVI